MTKPALMTAWDHYASLVLEEDEEPNQRDRLLLAFMGGAVTVIQLVRDAARRNGDKEGTDTFNALGREADAFSRVILEMKKDEP